MALVHVLTIAESDYSSCCVESDDNSFLSGFVNYSAKCSDDRSISDISFSAEVEVQPYYFEPKMSDSESAGHGDDHRGDFCTLGPDGCKLPLVM